MYNDLMSVTKSSSNAGMDSSGIQSQCSLSAKMNVVYSLLSMLGSTEDREDMSATLLSMSNSTESCIVMRQSGCLPLLIQLIHAPGQDAETRERASRALNNIVHAKNDEKSSRREIRILRLLEQLRDYCQLLRSSLDTRHPQDELERHPDATIAALMKLSFDELHRHAMCQLGGLHAVAELIEMDHLAHGSESNKQYCITLRRYAGMVLTNLTFADGNNKTLLCSFHKFMKYLILQLKSESDDLRQVTASVLRNLSWRADSSSKKTLREVGAVISLMKAAMEGRKESTLKSILSALWNLSAHCSTNKIDICAVEGALSFLVDMLSYNAPSKTLAIVENAGGILRNVSSHIAIRDDYRTIVRERGCLQVLLKQLRSPSLTVVSNACGALWNLSAICSQDQRLLWDLGAVPMLRSLVHSKHRMISMGSSAALKNLLSARPNENNLVHLDSTARGLGLPTLPSLMARRQKALEQEIDQNLAETCDNIEPSNSPINKDDKFSFKIDQSFLEHTDSDKLHHQKQIHPTITSQPPEFTGLKYTDFTRSESKESMRSNSSKKSDTIFEKINPQVGIGMPPMELQIKQQSTSLHSEVNSNNENSIAEHIKGQSEKKYTLRYMYAIPERLKPGEPLPDLRGLKYTTSTVSWTSTSNEDTDYSSDLLHSSNQDELSITNSNGSLNSKIDNSLHVKDIQKAVPPVGALFTNCAEVNFNQPVDYSLNYTEHLSDDDKQSSAYFTSTEHEKDSIETLSTESTSCQSSLNSRTSFTLHLPKENKTKTEFRRISKSAQNVLCAKSKNAVINSAASQNLKGESQAISRLKLLGLTSHESLLTLEQSIDNAMFEGNLQFQENSEVPSHSSVSENESEFVMKRDEIELNNLQYQANTESISEFINNKNYNNNENCFQNNRLRKSNSDIELYCENSLTRYKTNISLNDFENQHISNDVISMNRPNILTLLESENVDESQNDSREESKINYINDNQNIKTLNQKSVDCTLTQSCMTIDNVTQNDYDTNNLNLGSCNSSDSIEKSEQALLELCKTSEVPKPEMLLSAASGAIRKLNGNKNVFDVSKLAFISSSDDNICKSMLQTEEITSRSLEEYRRQRDPDAMIASLDRLTATLVQQTEAIREKDIYTMKSSLLSDTWNEDSPNEASFPSISTSVPLVSSFKSEIQEKPAIARVKLIDEDCNTSLTESKIIEIEAIKLAEAVGAKANQININSIDLHTINPPSTMGSLASLTASTGGLIENFEDGSRCYSLSFSPIPFSQSRKKSFPIGVVARRALGHGQIHTGSLENLLNEFNSLNNSQLENVKPPSIMDELLDMGDMENSMLSVASITSEIADCKETDFNSLSNRDMIMDLTKPIANIPSMTSMQYSEVMQGSQSLSECLENINPPSLFNEVNQMDDSLMEISVHCNNTLCFNADLSGEEISHCSFDERIEEISNNTDEAITPITSECSAESSPKKRLHKNQPGYLTPKQKRQLAKERYKTYTIAAERVKKEQNRRKQDQVNETNSKISIDKISSLSKLTPKQRRQENRSRFQTQILNKSVTDKSNSIGVLESETSNTPITEKSINQPPLKSGIPMLKKFSNGNKTFRSSCNIIHTNNERHIKKTFNIESTSEESDDQYENFFTCFDQIRVEKNTDSQLNKEIKNFNEASLPICESIYLKSDTPKIPQDGQISRTLSDDNVNELQKLVIANRDEFVEIDLESDRDSSEKAEIREIKGPRIVKPNILSRDFNIEFNATDTVESDIPKGIRGRRKALYSISNSRKSTLQSSPLKQVIVSRSNTTPVVRTTRAMTLRQNNNFQKSNSIPKLNTQLNTYHLNLVKHSSIPQKASTATFKNTCKRFSTPPNHSDDAEQNEVPKLLERKGTFTKDEPEMENAPMVLPISPRKSNFGISVDSNGKSSTKALPLQAQSKNCLRTPQKPNLLKLIKATSVERISVTNIPKITKRLSTNLDGSVKSSKCQIIPNTDSGIPRKVSLGHRSSTNSNIVSDTSIKVTRNKAMKDTSRIASLWKKVEENKNKQKFEKPDSRQWITQNQAVIQDDLQNGDKNKTSKFLRSSTYGGTSKNSETLGHGLMFVSGKITTV